MNMNSFVRPLLGLALVITGCGKTEIEYRTSSKAKVVDASKPTDKSDYRRHEQAETTQTTTVVSLMNRRPPSIWNRSPLLRLTRGPTSSQS